MYEIKKVSLKSKVFKVFCLVAGSLLIAFLYMWFVTSVLKVDLPKTAFLKAEHARLDARLDLLNSKMDRDQEILDGLRVRDEDVYRSIFGRWYRRSGQVCVSRWSREGQLLEKHGFEA